MFSTGSLRALPTRRLPSLVLLGLGALCSRAHAVCPPDVGPGEDAILSFSQVVSVNCTVAATGTLTTSGSPTIAASARVDLGGTLLITGTLFNQGQLVTRAGSDMLVLIALRNMAGAQTYLGGRLFNNATVDNQAGALFTIGAGADFQSTAGTSFQNRGVLRFETDVALGDARYSQVQWFAGSTVDNRARMTLAVPQYTMASEFVNGAGGSLTVADGQSLTVGPGFSNQAGGSVQVSGRLAVTQAGVLSNAGQMNFNRLNFTTMQVGSVLNQAGGRMTLDTSSALRAVNLFDNASGATLESDWVLESANEFRNAGTLRANGGVLAVSFAQAAGITTLRFGALIQARSVRFDGGTLAGRGTVYVTDGSRVAEFAGGAALAPGDAPGMLDRLQIGVPSASTDLACLGCGLQFDVAGLAAAGHDRLHVFGSALLGAGTQVGLSFIDGFAPQSGDRIDLLTTTLGLTLDALPAVTISGLQAGFQYTLVNENGALSLLALNDALPLPVPEPATVWLLAVGLLAVTAGGARKRRACAP